MRCHGKNPKQAKAEGGFTADTLSEAVNRGAILKIKYVCPTLWS